MARRARRPRRSGRGDLRWNLLGCERKVACCAGFWALRGLPCVPACDNDSGASLGQCPCGGLEKPVLQVEGAQRDETCLAIGSSTHRVINFFFSSSSSPFRRRDHRARSRVVPCPSICFYSFHLFSWVVLRDVYLLFCSKPEPHVLVLTLRAAETGVMKPKCLLFFFPCGLAASDVVHSSVE